MYKRLWGLCISFFILSSLSLFAMESDISFVNHAASGYKISENLSFDEDEYSYELDEKYPYRHRYQGTFSIMPYPYFGFTSGLEYNYMYKRLGIGICSSFCMYFRGKITGDDLSNACLPGDLFINFVLGSPIKFYIFPPKYGDGLYLDISVVPGWIVTNNHENKKQSDTNLNGFSTEFRIELGYDLYGFSIDSIIGYNMNTLKDFVVAGIGCSIFIEK